jgi:hypothetical protein
MPTDLERRLEETGDRLPVPSEAISRLALERALASLPSSPEPRLSHAHARSRIRLVGVAAAVTLIAAIALALATNFQGSSSPFTPEKALAAIGDGPVIHAVVESEEPWATIVDLESGHERQQKYATEFWYDGQRGFLRARATVDGQLLNELLQTREGGTSTGGSVLGPPREPQLDPALAGFATRYRAALESGEARIVAETEVDGRDVARLEIRSLPDPRPDLREQVDLDAKTLQPLRFRYLSGERVDPWWRVLSIETLPRDAGQFAPPAPRRVQPQAQTSTQERELTPAEAARALDRPALRPGRVVEGVELTTLELMKETTLWTDGHETESHALVLEYGGGRFRTPRWLEVREGTNRELRPRIGPDDPHTVPGQLQLFGNSSVNWWAGYLEIDGVFLTLKSSDRDLIITAARALEPIVGEGG